MTLESLHDLRQPLTAIQNFTRAGINELRRHPEGGGKVFGWLESANQQAKRASEMLKEARAQGPSVNCPTALTDIKLCIEKILKGPKGESGMSACVLNAKSDEYSYFLIGDSELLEAVFRDLLVTTIDSTPRSDAITRVLNIGIDRENADLVLEIGADVAVFGSTGEVDAGGVTGHQCSAMIVGLSACAAIIERHGGLLTLWKRQDGTVRVRVRLPAYQLSGGSA